MAKPRIALVVGNGLSMSYGKFSGLSEKWDSQYPLDWNVECPQNGGPLLDQLPTLKQLKNTFTHLNDFEVFKKLQALEECEKLGISTFKGLIEARHYLTIAFSKLATLQIQNFNKNWGWFKWLAIHKENLSCATSLNYDLLLEHCLDELHILYTYHETLGHHYGIPISKPHGSVNFEMRGIVSPTAYPLINWIDLNDMPMYKIDNDNLLKVRLEPLCIAPNEINKYLKHHWVTSIKNSFLTQLNQCTHCLFIGISYFECDRHELNEIIKAIPKNAEIIMVNPTPSAEFIDSIGDRPIVFWKSFNSPLRDDNDQPMMLKNPNTGELLKKCFCGSGISYQHCHAI